MGSVRFSCRQCGGELMREVPGQESSSCEHCQVPVTLRPDFLDEQGRVRRCPACGLKVLYRQRDFNRTVGCLVVLIAAVLAPFTYYISLGIAALIDAVLYTLTREVLICYRYTCRAQVRGIPPGPWVKPFDLLTHDYHRSLADRPEDQSSPPPPEGVKTGGPEPAEGS